MAYPVSSVKGSGSLENEQEVGDYFLGGQSRAGAHHG